MVIIEIGVGTNVPINFRDSNLCTLVTFPWLAHLYLALSGDGCALFHLYFHGFNSFSKEIMVDNSLFKFSAPLCEF